MGGSWRDRLSMLSRAEIIGLLVVLGITLVGGASWYLRSLPQPVEIRAVDRPSARPASPSPASLIVDVAGWVRRPGVYDLAEGDRVIDALEAAGGARPDAILTSLNLAAPLTDGQQVLVPEPVRGPVAFEAAPGEDASGKININTADATQLETLSGIGEVLAERIIEHRESNGPFASVDDLLEVSGIGDATLAEFRDEITT